MMRWPAWRGVRAPLGPWIGGSLDAEILRERRYLWPVREDALLVMNSHDRVRDLGDCTARGMPGMDACHHRSRRNACAHGELSGLHLKEDRQSPMLDPFGGHSDEATIVEIAARHAVARSVSGMDSERQYRDLLQNLPAAIYTTDAEGRITFFNRACIDFAGRTPKIGEMWCVTWKLYLPDGTPLPHDECPMAVALKENRPIRDAEAIAERPDGSRICFMPHPTPLRDECGRLTGAVNMLVDITARKLAEERMKLLTSEVDHRSNNLLAVVQAMLRLTKADTAEEFQAAFQGRLGALANVQRLFSASRWTGASLRVLVEEELRPYGIDDAKRVNISGEDIRLPAALAQGIAVAVHELATNAAKYGSLSTPSGRLEIRWNTGGVAPLVLHWSESGGPCVKEPTRTGFGVGAIDSVIRTLCGTITRHWRPEGLVCELSFPNVVA
ncbi:PAS domain S-box protein [Bradyrhizobium pachyrhizi]|uniref:Blue-light-activated histidine kinase n=1 Tax=Bradyrhizobium pachyrhizi TaxID=280333 RepID=A0A844T689_9BRAD|nr:PAS domain S-box protein [Bradyrhizobium pachyrhizi]